MKYKNWLSLAKIIDEQINPKWNGKKIENITSMFSKNCFNCLSWEKSWEWWDTNSIVTCFDPKSPYKWLDVYSGNTGCPSFEWSTDLPPWIDLINNLVANSDSYDYRNKKTV